ncbi:MAG: hypothetical protein K2I70_05145, partial [Bacilli bacterium]|nr:hypothetical protein [Bacilli bacterium]
DLYIGCIDYEGERIITILYQKDDNYYPVFFNQESSNRMERIEQRLKQNAKAIISLSSLLEIKGLSHLIEPIYDKKILEYIALTINEKGYSMDKLITSNLEYLEEYPNEEIPSDELYITKSGIIRQNKNSRLKEERQKNSAELNEVLKLSGLSSLIDESYDIKKLEYIMLSLKDNLRNIPSIVTEPAPPQKHLLTEIFYDVFYNLINPVEKKSIKENEDHLSHSFIKTLEKKVIRGIDDGLLEKKLGRLIINVMGYSVYNKYRNYAQKRDDNFEYFAGIRKYFENIIVNYDSRSGITIYEYLDNYASAFNEHIEKNPHVKLLISALKMAYSNDPNDVIISHRGDSLIISRQDDKGKDDLPVACILNT